MEVAVQICKRPCEHIPISDAVADVELRGQDAGSGSRWRPYPGTRKAVMGKAVMGSVLAANQDATVRFT